MPTTHSTLAEVVEVLHAQGSKTITLEVMQEQCSIVQDWHQDDEDYPCVTFNNGVRWFYDKDRRPKTKSGAPMKALASTGSRSFLGDLQGDGDLVIFEGERDFLTALSIGLSNAICAGGATNVDEQQRQYIAQRNTVTVFFDNDEAGQAAAKKLCAELAVIGAGQVKSTMPPVAGQDFSDWVENLPFQEETLGIVLARIRKADKMGKREAKKILKEEGEKDAPPPMTDEFKTKDGDLVVLIYEYDDPEAPHDQEQGLAVRFAHFDIRASKVAGMRVVNYSDTWENAPVISDQVDMYDGPDDSPGSASPELQPVLRPLRGDWAEKRVVLFPTGHTPYGESESLFDDLLAYIDQYYICEPEFRAAMAAYVLLSYRYRDAEFETVPYIRVMGPPGYGKTRFLRVMRELCYRSAMLTNMRPVHIYRLLAAMKSGVTMVLEELALNEKGEDGREFLSMLNAGNQRGSWVPRMTGHNFSDMEFLPVFCPKVLTLKTEFSDPGMIRRCITGLAIPRDVPEAKRFAKLPREFYMIADKLRKRLLDWRFAQILKGPPANIDDGGLNMGIWQNWYPVLAMVPDSRPKYKEQILSLAGDAESGLTIAHQSSTEAQVVAACVKHKDLQGKAWLHIVLAELNEGDRNARWQKSDVLRTIRSMNIKPARSKVSDGEGGYVNEFFIDVDRDIHPIIDRFKFDIAITDAGARTTDDVM